VSRDQRLFPGPGTYDGPLDLIGKDNAFYSKTNGLWIFLPHGHKRVHVEDYVLLTEDKVIKVYESIDFTKEFEPVP
jgi:hypothetical protein